MGTPPLAKSLVVERASEVIDEAMGDSTWKWNPTTLEVLAIATDGPYGLAVVDAHGDRVELQSQLWRFASEHWSLRATQLVEGPGAETRKRWSGGSTGFITDAFYRNYGFAPGCRTVEIVFESARHEVPVIANGFWAFVSASHGHAELPAVRPRR